MSVASSSSGSDAVEDAAAAAAAPPPMSAPGTRVSTPQFKVQPQPPYAGTAPGPGPLDTFSRAKPRPPPLDLSGARDAFPQFRAEEAFAAERRHSLPPYLLQAYSGMALGAPVPRPRHESFDPSAFLVSDPGEVMGFSRYVPVLASSLEFALIRAVLQAWVA